MGLFADEVLRFKCLATVVSRSCAMSLKWPWNRINRRFLVPQILHEMT